MKLKSITVTLITSIALITGVLALSGCATAPSAVPGAKALSPAGQIALAEATNIAVRRYIASKPNAAIKVSNIRAIVADLQTVTNVTTVSGLKDIVIKEIDARVHDPVDNADAKSLANILYAVVLEHVGSNAIDSAALVKVNEVFSMILAALPASA